MKSRIAIIVFVVACGILVGCGDPAQEPVKNQGPIPKAGAAGAAGGPVTTSPSTAVEADK